MLKCNKCCKNMEEYHNQFPTTLYEGIKCDVCGRLMFEDMEGTFFYKDNKIHYTSKKDALSARREGERVYYSSQNEGYYIIRLSSVGWGF